MSKIEMLRLLITQRLTEAAEEIFGVFGRTIAEYEEEISRSKLEIDRQRRLLELTRQPQVSLQLSGSALCEPAEWSDLKPAPIKEEEQEQEEEEEQEELWSAQEEAEPSDIGFLLFRHGGARHEQDGERASSSLSCQDADDTEPDPRPGTSVRRGGADPDPDRGEVLEPAAGNGRPDGAEPDAPLSEVVDSYICTICGRAFAQRSHWAKHVQVHRKNDAKADKSFTCDICGKRLTRFDGYQKHLRIHTGEKPYSCAECGRRFSDNSNYKRHIRTHVAPKPHS